MIFVFLAMILIYRWLDTWARNNPASGLRSGALAFYVEAVKVAFVFWMFLMAPIVTQRIQSIARVHREMQAERSQEISFSSPPTRSDKQWLGLDRESRFSR